MKNGHLQTAFPYFFRKVKSELFVEERIELSDGDFIDIDFYDANSKDLVVITHGLEGSSDRSYVRGQAHYLAEKHKLDVVAWNMRSCSGEINRMPYFYHAAQTQDIDQVIEHCFKKKKYQRVHLIGFSLGGALTSYYATRIGRNHVAEINSVTCVSSPLCLEESIYKLSSSRTGMVYTDVFLKTMKQKTLQKKKLGILDISDDLLKRCKNFIDFDELITAPSFGFKNAKEYYDFASSYKQIVNVDVPTLLLQAKDDPFLTRKSYPMRGAKKNSNLYLEMTMSGGHIGFISTRPRFEYWFEKRVADFIQSNIDDH